MHRLSPQCRDWGGAWQQYRPVYPGMVRHERVSLLLADCVMQIQTGTAVHRIWLMIGVEYFMHLSAQLMSNFL